MVSYLQVENLTKSFGDKVLFENISFGIHEGQRVALIARNGAGKSTLLNLLSGRDVPDEGRITFRNDLRVGFLEQTPPIAGSTVADACFACDNEVVQTIAHYEQLIHLQECNPEAFAGREQEFETVLGRMDTLRAWDYEIRIKQILGRLGIYDLDAQVAHLSGGQQKRLALANVLITEPDLLILDEPTNHLDLAMVEWLEDLLIGSKMTLLIVTHDRYFLDRVCSDIIEIDDQQIYQYRGNYSYYLEKREERLLNREAERKRLNSLYKKELEWMRRQPQARGTKSQSRIDAFREIEQRAKRRVEEKKLLLGGKSEYIGSKIFEVQYVSKSFGTKRILDQFYYNFARYEKLGIVGQNGTGKSTFIKMLLGEEPVDSGRFDVGETVRFGYYSQAGLSFDEQKKVIDVAREVAEVVDCGGGKRLTASQFLSYFLFEPERQYDYVYKLSGGERRRLYLCSVLMRNPNFLVLDEPTNDLDISSLNVLEEYLAQFRGCLIVVSHDRFFMDKIVDHLLVFEGDAKIKDFPGNYTDFREWKQLQEADAQEREVATKNTPIRSRAVEEGAKKLSYKERKEYEALEQEIAQMEEEKAQIEAALSDGTISQEQITQLSERFAFLAATIDEKSIRWFELAERV